jgi:hypothetical protein
MYPKNLPNEKIQEIVTSPLPTSHTIPLPIKINKRKDDPMTISRPRVLIAILQAMQNVFPDSYIVPQVISDQHKGFFNINMIKSCPEILSHYFEDADDAQSGSLLTRVYVNSSHTLSEYKKNPKFNKYMSQEHIILEEIR